MIEITKGGPERMELSVVVQGHGFATSARWTAGVNNKNKLFVVCLARPYNRTDFGFKVIGKFLHKRLKFC